jgi:hypothetical protein
MGAFDVQGPEEPAFGSGAIAVANTRTKTRASDRELPLLFTSVPCHTAPLKGLKGFLSRFLD